VISVRIRSVFIPSSSHEKSGKNNMREGEKMTQKDMSSQADGGGRRHMAPYESNGRVMLRGPKNV